MTTTAVDWSVATVTAQAKNNPKQSTNVPTVRVPREVFDKYWPLPWSELERAGADGVDGLELWVIAGTEAPSGFAYMREGLKSDHWLKGQSLLFHQNWM